MNPPQKPPWGGLHCCGNTLKCTGRARGGSGSTAGFQVLGGPSRAPPLSTQGVQVHLDPLASAEHPHGGEEPPGGDPDLPAPHNCPVPSEENLGGKHGGSAPYPQKNRGKRGSKAKKDEPEGEGRGYFRDLGCTDTRGDQRHTARSPQNTRAGRGDPNLQKSDGKGVDPRVSDCKGNPVGLVGGIFGVMEGPGVGHKHVWGHKQTGVHPGI